MLPNQPLYSRMDTLELRNQIIKKIGHQRAEKYFSHLKKLFSAKLTKSEFDKLCIRTIGRETISLHNQLIRSILRNACDAKDPPPYKKHGGGKVPTKDSNGHQRSSLQSLYGDAFPLSPRKGRSPAYRDRKFKDRPSPLGPLANPQSIITSEDLGASKQQSATELLSLGSRPPVEVASVEDGEEVEQAAGSPGVQSRSPVTAPLGIFVNLGGSRKIPPATSHSGSDFDGRICQNNGFLPNTQSLRSLLMHKLESEGLKISVDCANVLNNGLDSYMKRLIEPCLILARSRQDRMRAKQMNLRDRSGINRHAPAMPEYVHASPLDFRAAMEIDPQVLGEYWPTHLERICSRTTEG